MTVSKHKICIKSMDAANVHCTIFTLFIVVAAVSMETVNHWLINSELFDDRASTNTKMVIKYYGYDDIDVKQTM